MGHEQNSAKTFDSYLSGNNSWNFSLRFACLQPRFSLVRFFVPGRFTACLGIDFAPVFFTGQITKVECTGALRRDVFLFFALLQISISFIGRVNLQQS